LSSVGNVFVPLFVARTTGDVADRTDGSSPRSFRP
jgi:hypothetical protein